MVWNSTRFTVGPSGPFHWAGDMKKSESEPIIRRLAKDWFATLPKEKQEHPSFSTFKEWLSTKGYSRYLNFRSVAGANYDAEMWFDHELGQNWRR
jgi:hypothetical protein